MTDLRVYDFNDIIDKRKDFSNRFINITKWRKSHSNCDLDQINDEEAFSYYDNKDLLGATSKKSIRKSHCFDCSKWTIYEFDYIKLACNTLKEEKFIKMAFLIEIYYSLQWNREDIESLLKIFIEWDFNDFKIIWESFFSLTGDLKGKFNNKEYREDVKQKDYIKRLETYIANIKDKIFDIREKHFRYVNAAIFGDKELFIEIRDFKKGHYVRFH